MLKPFLLRSTAMSLPIDETLFEPEYIPPTHVQEATMTTSGTKKVHMTFDDELGIYEALKEHFVTDDELGEDGRKHGHYRTGWNDRKIGALVGPHITVNHVHRIRVLKFGYIQNPAVRAKRYAPKIDDKNTDTNGLTDFRRAIEKLTNDVGVLSRNVAKLMVDLGIKPE